MLYVNYKFLIALVSILIVLVNVSYSHDKVVKGKVFVQNGEKKPVIGASVRIKNTVLGAVTNKKGEYVIKGVPDGTHTLVISAVGMETIIDEITLEHSEGDEYLKAYEMVENPIKTSSVVVTATRSEKIYDDVPIKVSTMSEEDFRVTSSVNIRESLQFQPGVRTEVNCQNCSFSQVRINGLDGKYSQILINGKAIFSSLNGVYGLEQIPVNMIDRIEVVRGGGSSLYGGSAIAGVINVITKEPCFNTFDVSLTNRLINNSLPENILNVNGTVMNDDQSMGISLFGMLNDRHEFDANGDGFTEMGRLDVSTFGSSLFWKMNPKAKITGDFNVIQHEIRGGNNLDLAPHQSDITEMVEHSTIMGQVSYEQFVGDANKFNFYISGQQTRRDSYYGAEQDINAYGTTDNVTSALGFNYNHAVSFLGQHYFTVGYELNYDEMQDNAPAYNRYIDQTTRAHGIILQDDWSLNDKINLLWGARIDHHNLIEDMVFNPRLSALFKPWKSLSFRATYSTGYRAPQAFDEDLHITQVGGEGFVIQVADGLLPEFSNSFSGSIDYSFNLGHTPMAVSAEYFYTRLDDAFALIDVGADANDNRIFERQNAESAIVQGFTFELQGDIFNRLDLTVGATVQTSLYSEAVEWSEGDSEAGIEAQFSDRIFRTPDLYGYVTASYDILDNLFFDFSGYYTGPMVLPHYAGFIEQDRLFETDSFFDANVKLTYSLGNSPTIDLSISVLNAFNQYQSNFDQGINRDAGFIYGPFRPITTQFGVALRY